MVSLPGKLIKVSTLMTVLAATLFTTPTFAAPMLHGHVEDANEAQEQQQQQTAAPKLQALIENSFPAGYEGTYHCVTTVVDSGVASVPVGQVMLSEIEFAHGQDGRIIEHWAQPGWTETQSTITSYNDRESRVDRTSYFFGENMQGNWAARTRDQFTQMSPHSIVAKSYVDQYLDGQYLGRYRTTSVLEKQSGPANIALAK